ncbi:hypothetical protein ASD11_06725 [Aeromicrobium sp. Root495]|uniref:maleylpyruvate isomerase family mycothiol-dependent enzyme n=1 Tax=Aeromicrobium sp. Root495 TaxID=1736550 RepID=UPI0006F76610|nr:maleylpyruvate isomerase family mycothiol-dependent enzyme [Aeromicrobium sp. Root495]KQY59266.1 hypothetical protein ASD11_06725 [Aeromicrobium sp. Root495]
MHALVDALGTLRHVVDGVQDSDLGRPTPCDGLDLGAVISHVIGWQQVFTAALDGRPLPWDGSSPTYVAGESRRDDLDDSSARLVAAIERSGDDIDLPFRGSTTREVLTTELTAETVLHTWDVAQALGRTIAYHSRVVMTAGRGLTLLRAESFGPEAFAPALNERTSDPLLRLVRRSGRGPWPQD